MRLRITEINLDAEPVLTLVSEGGHVFYVMARDFYKQQRIRNPFSQKKLESFAVGHWINAAVQQIGQRNIVVEAR